MFKIKGLLSGREVEIKWDKGKLSGDDLLVEAVRSTARIEETVGPPGGPHTDENHLDSALSASVIIADMVLDYGTADVIEGVWPLSELPEVSDGAEVSIIPAIAGGM